MRCSVCGADNLEGSVYCEDCGARLPAAAAAAVTQEASGVVAAAPAPTPIAPPVAATPPPPVPVAPTPDPTPPPTATPTVAASANQNCSACGAVNPVGVAFCEDCGASLSETHAPIEASPPPTPVSYDAPAAATPAPVATAPTPAVGASRLVHTSGREFMLQKDLILMGRRSPVDGIYPEVDLTELDVESYISRKHGRLSRQGDVFVYEDLGSSNGSFHNGARLQPHIQTPLKEGDSIRLGKTELFLRS